MMLTSPSIPDNSLGAQRTLAVPSLLYTVFLSVLCRSCPSCLLDITQRNYCIYRCKFNVSLESSYAAIFDWLPDVITSKENFIYVNYTIGQTICDKSFRNAQKETHNLKYHATKI